MKRIHKKRHIEEEAESWAVSYADLLMVLMSFFIVFFNIDDSGEKTLVDIIAKGFQKEDGRVPSSGSNGSKAGALKGLEEALNEKGSKIKVYTKVGNIENAYGNAKESQRSDKDTGVDALIQKKKNEKIIAQRGLIIELSNDIFDIGAYELNNYVKNEIDQVLSNLEAHKDKIQLVAIGHADKIPMSASRKVINSNFILSSLRASKAVEYIISKGFDPYWVSGKAVSVENRSTRSLSLRVVER